MLINIQIMDFGLLFTLFCSLLESARCSCYFPSELHGTFLMQSPGFYGGRLVGSSVVALSEILIEADAIPPWGKCHQRRGNNVILKDSTGGEDCMRCLHLTLNSPNVIQIHTEGLGKCYTKEEVAKATCPDDKDVLEKKFKEIMLYRKQDVGDDHPQPENVFCPINGKFRFTYRANEGDFRCDQTLSEISNCPSGNSLTVLFKKCSFPNVEIKFKCLGDWEGTDNTRYLALMDIRGLSEDRPKFRCGMYKIDPLTGRFYVSLSADSTCHNQLRSPTDGYESLILTPFPRKAPPVPVRQAHCKFPDWAQGEWEDLSVQGNAFTYGERTQLKTIMVTCLLRESQSQEDRFVVFTTTHCSEESYNCVWLKRRGPNVMEFQLGLESSPIYSDQLCHDLQFNSDSWITRGRHRPTLMSPCPITGDYTGVLPESSGTLCAKVASDCNNPEVMFYTVSNCLNKSQVYEEREYRCLGSWDEKNGVTFTYTQRREMPGYQCFTGKVAQNGKEAHIKEAGHSCIRGEDPAIYGMKIVKHASCPDMVPSIHHGAEYPGIKNSNSDANHEEPLANPTTDDLLWFNKDDTIQSSDTSTNLVQLSREEDKPKPNGTKTNEVSMVQILALFCIIFHGKYL